MTHLADLAILQGRAVRDARRCWVNLADSTTLMIAVPPVAMTGGPRFNIVRIGVTTVIKPEASEGDEPMLVMGFDGPPLNYMSDIDGLREGQMSPGYVIPCRYGTFENVDWHEMAVSPQVHTLYLTSTYSTVRFCMQWLHVD